MIVYEIRFGLLTLIATTSQSSLSTRREGEEGESKYNFILWCLNKESFYLYSNFNYCNLSVIFKLQINVIFL